MSFPWRVLLHRRGVRRAKRPHRFVNAILVRAPEEVLFSALKSADFGAAADQAARFRRWASATVHASVLAATWSSGSIGTVHAAFPGGADASASATMRPAAA